VRAVPSDAVGGHDQSADDAERAEGEERGGEGDLLDGRPARAPDGAADEVVVVGDGEGVVHVRHGRAEPSPREVEVRMQERKEGSGPCAVESWLGAADGMSLTARRRAREGRRRPGRRARRVGRFTLIDSAAVSLTPRSLLACLVKTRDDGLDGFVDASIFACLLGQDKG
jgi:hypothetical protein